MIVYISSNEKTDNYFSLARNQIKDITKHITEAFIIAPVLKDDFEAPKLEDLLTADCILMLEGWEKSIDAIIEMDFSRRNGIPIFYNTIELIETVNRNKEVL
jgi:hypothetical protein